MPVKKPSKSRLMLTLLAALTISTASACSSDASSPEPVAAPVEGVSVELKTPGQAPQSPLAWFVDNTEQKVTYSATQGLEQKTLHGKSGEDLPYGEVTMSLPLTASSTSNGKTHTQQVTVGAPDGSNKELNEDMATAEGFEMRTTVEDDGRATERSFIAPEEASDGAKASIEMALTQMNSLPLVFPREPVGVGAKWTVSNRVDEGVSLRQEVTYELNSRQGRNVALSVDIERRPAVSSLADTDLRVLDASSKTQGHVQLDLTRPLPVRGHVNVETTVTYGKKNSPLRVIQKSTSRNEWK